jgi:uncharacterized protein (DUF427 family)
MLTASPAIIAARGKWAYRGQKRPPFAEPVGEGELSVWDFPRPPRLESVSEVLRVVHGESEIARSENGRRVLETAGAPTYYLPPGDVREVLMVELDMPSICEWKGVATSFALADDPARSTIAWCYRETFPEFADIQGWYAFYPNRLSCFVGDERVNAQPGGYYGGWVTQNLKGPIKGEPGSGHW